MMRGSAPRVSAWQFTVTILSQIFGLSSEIYPHGPLATRVSDDRLRGGGGRRL
jgi:hypothetical protein